MTFKELISLCEPIDVTGPEPSEIGMLKQDSREITAGDVFIAVSGFNVDGHSFINGAVENGASVIISEESYYTAEDVCILEVPNTRALVGPLAQAFEGNPAEKLEIIGITGTNGKTTVATLIFQILKKMGVAPSLLGTNAKRIGVHELKSNLTTADPVELAGDMSKMVEAGSTHLVMEVSSHALDQQRVKGVNFEVAAFTNLSHDHLDYHQNLESYAESKKKLFDGLHTDANAIVNADDDHAAFITMDCPADIIDFSFQKALDVECQVLSNTIDGLIVRIGQTIVESPLVGSFNAYNITEAFLSCRALGFDADAIAEALKSAPGAAGRLERVEESTGKQYPAIFVDYAHTPDALENVVSTLADLKKEDQLLHIVFGCGGNRDKTKRPKMAKIAEEFGDKVTVTSDNPRNENPDDIIDDIMEGFKNPDAITRITDREEAITQAVSNADFRHMILIAGKGHETYQEVKGERLDFDDRKAARQALDHYNMNTKKRGG